MNGVVTALVQYGVPALAVVAAAAITSLFVHRGTEKAHEVSKTVAQATVNDTFTKAYEAADKHWARYNEAMQKWNEELAEKIKENTRQIADLEMRIVEADQHAQDWQKLFHKTKIYVRKLIQWIQETVPHEEFPQPPSELDIDL